MTILLTGKQGQVGFELQRSLAPLAPVVALGRNELDLANPDSIRSCLRSLKPKVVVNPAAYTAVDRAESDIAAAMAVNGTALAVLGEEAAALGALVVHFSTDYVFDGSKSGKYVETDLPNPLGGYGRSKLAGERALAESGARYLIFRTSWVFGAHGANFAKTILRLAGERESLRIVADQWGAPTCAALIADATAQVLGQYLHRANTDFPFGLYHLAADGETTWHAYAEAVIAAAREGGRPGGLRVREIVPISSAEYPTPARRPLNSRLDTSLLRHTFGLAMPPWQLGLSHVLQSMLD